MSDDSKEPGNGDDQKKAESQPNSNEKKEENKQPSELDQAIKSRDAERETNKQLRKELQEMNQKTEDEKKAKEQADLEAKGQFDEVKAGLEAEITSLKTKADRLDALNEKAKAENEKTIEEFEESQRDVVKLAIEGKDPIVAKALIEGLKQQFAKDGKQNVGSGIKADEEDSSSLTSQLEAKQKESQDFRDKVRSGGILSDAEKRTMLKLPSEIAEIKKKLEKTN